MHRSHEYLAKIAIEMRYAGPREMFARHEPIPPEFSRAEVVAVLQEYYDSVVRQ